jgi:hypothetical protein
VIATDQDTGAAVTFDQGGNATGQLPISGNAVPDWDAQMLAAASSGVASLAYWVEIGTGYATAAGGNPSTNGTFVPNLGLAESHPLWGRVKNAVKQAVVGEGADCKLGADTDKVLLAGDALGQYTTLRQNELTFVESLTPDSKCEKPFLSSPVLANYVPMLANGVRNQVAWDGDQSHLSNLVAGLWNIKMQVEHLTVGTWDSYSQAPVCSQFYKNGNGDWNGVTAVAQVSAAPWDTDVYIFPKKKGWSLLTSAAILHEALHNLTGFDDEDLYKALTGKGLGGQKSKVITVFLHDQGCEP